ncbi:MAG: fumarylacetoacetate hydrolase family protein [Muribaculaceae bacterium]|nr:fumarylacetoacetate hydrolase family protein [Muribaculaceae bacterium]
MKVIVVPDNYGDKGERELTGWYFIADSAVTNTGKPFYLPEDKGRVSVSLSTAVRFNRLGKGISPKFASRYYTEHAPALHFRLTDYAAQLKENGLPEDPARSFDRSLFVGEFTPIKGEDKFTLHVNGREVSEYILSELHTGIDQLISEVSKMNTIKMGDLLLPGLSQETEIKEGDLLEVRLNGEKAFQVRVK